MDEISGPAVSELDTAAIQRAADALYELAQSTGGGHCPPSWSGYWREWYRHVARVALTAAAYPEDVKA